MRTMLFIDFENFEISKTMYYKNSMGTIAPKTDFTKLPNELVNRFLSGHELLGTFLFAPKPDQFLMTDSTRKATYTWISGLNNLNFFSVIEGRHVARPTNGFTSATMNISDKNSYYVVEKGTDVNLATHVILKAMHNSFDAAIIMSGDTDYIPVMDVLNMMGKTVIIACIKGQRIDRFKKHTDAQIVLDDTFFSSCTRA